MKRAILLIATIITTITAGAQHLSGGPVAGFGQSWLGATPELTDFKASPYLGFSLIDAGDYHWGWGTEIGISHEGYKKNYPLAAGTYDLAVNPVYMRIPLRLYHFLGNYDRCVRPFMYIGPSIGFNVDETHYVNGKRVNDDNTQTLSQYGLSSNMYSGIDLGVDLGAGFNIKLSRVTALNVSGDYYHGAIDAMPGGKYNTNQYLRLNIGLMLGM